MNFRCSTVFLSRRVQYSTAARIPSAVDDYMDYEIARGLWNVDHQTHSLPPSGTSGGLDIKQTNLHRRE